jgi:hypothetical protein
MIVVRTISLIAFAALALAPTAAAAAAPSAKPAPTGVRAEDKPDDGGRSIAVTWAIASEQGLSRFDIIRMDAKGARITAGTAMAVDRAFTDGDDAKSAPEDGVPYRYVIRAVFEDGGTADSAASAAVIAVPSWVHRARLPGLIAVVVLAAMFGVIVIRARRGATFYIRPIAALEAMDDAVGRAAEMGRPVLYAPGLHSVTEPVTLASMGILSRVAERAARLHTRIKVPNYEPLTYPVTQEIVRRAFAKVGLEEEYQPDDVAYLTSRSFTYAAAVAGMMTRERTASNFFIGHFFSEYLILAETGVATGAVQIGGTDSVAQLPFVITTCDHTMIGEEVFAAAALVGDDPVSRSTIRAHDWFKLLIFAFVILGAGLKLAIDAGALAWTLDGLGVDGAQRVIARITAALYGG